MSEIESLRSIIEASKISLKGDIKYNIREEFDAREVGGPIFVQSNIILLNIDKLLVQNQELIEMNYARNLDNNCTSFLFMNNSGASFNQFEVDPKDEILIMVDEDYGYYTVTDREGYSFFLNCTMERMVSHAT